MNCLLFNSPIYRIRFDLDEEYLPPLGLGYIATQIKASGINVEIIDCVKERLGIKEIFELLKLRNAGVYWYKHIYSEL